MFWCVVTSVTVYLYSLFVFLLDSRTRQNTVQLVKLYSNTTTKTSKKIYLYVSLNAFPL